MGIKKWMDDRDRAKVMTWIKEGMVAYKEDCFPYADNPYRNGTREHGWWGCGWEIARLNDEELP